jgi:hypothetical protein
MDVWTLDFLLCLLEVGVNDLVGPAISVLDPLDWSSLCLPHPTSYGLALLMPRVLTLDC